MIEAEVQDAFAKYLIEHGWEVKTDNHDHTDVIARRGDELLVAEVKGTTSEPGLDVDTAYGQLLRRMQDRPEAVRYALVVPESALRFALRVSDEVRGKLGIDVWTVDEG
jgi:Holliday junction resolvase